MPARRILSRVKLRGASVSKGVAAKKRRGGPRPILSEPVTVSLRVDRLDHERLAQAARIDQIHISAVVRRAIREYLARLNASSGPRT